MNLERDIDLVHDLLSPVVPAKAGTQKYSQWSAESPPSRR